MTDELTLTATLRPAALDARRGIVRLHPQVLAALAINPGDPVRLVGRRATAGIAARAEPGAGRGLLYADDLILGNLGLRDGGQVTVTPVPAVAARSVTLAGPAEIVAVVSPEMLRLALLGKVVSAGDDVSLLPQDVLPQAGHRPLVEAARQSLANRVGYAWTSTLLTVTAVADGDAALVTMDTVVAWLGGAATHEPGSTTATVRPPATSPTAATNPSGAPAQPGAAPAAFGPGPADTRPTGAPGDSWPTGAPVGTRPTGADPASGDATSTDAGGPPGVEDLPGLRAQAQELTELLDLGFHHREVLGRLGTTVTLGVLLTGPAGSGKSALVRAVAAEVGASVVSMWGPELAALTNDAAASRLRSAAQQARDTLPAVLLVSDVDALAPRDEPGPLATVLRQVLAETVRSGAAVVCATSRPESVQPELRAPDLLAVQIAVPLPDAA
ncbi:MAG TPA: AAA family ATPase, partial [Actinoplanes sp.]|nr:AAA family ATPase [Actinoplanes sp.]